MAMLDVSFGRRRPLWTANPTAAGPCGRGIGGRRLAGRNFLLGPTVPGTVLCGHAGRRLRPTTSPADLGPDRRRPRLGEDSAEGDLRGGNFLLGPMGPGTVPQQPCWTSALADGVPRGRNPTAAGSGWWKTRVWRLARHNFLLGPTGPDAVPRRQCWTSALSDDVPHGYPTRPQLAQAGGRLGDEGPRDATSSLAPPLQNINVVMLDSDAIFHFCESNTRFWPKLTSKPF